MNTARKQASCNVWYISVSRDWLTLFGFWLSHGLYLGNCHGKFFCFFHWSMDVSRGNLTLGKSFAHSKQVASPSATGITVSAVRYRTYRSTVYMQMKGTWRARGTSLPSPWSGVRECSKRTWLKSVVVCTIINPSESGSHESSHKGNTWPRLWEIDSHWLGARAQRIPKVKKKHWVVADKNENKTSNSVFVWIL